MVSHTILGVFRDQYVDLIDLADVDRRIRDRLYHDRSFKFSSFAVYPDVGIRLQLRVGPLHCPHASVSTEVRIPLERQ